MQCFDNNLCERFIANAPLLTLSVSKINLLMFVLLPIKLEQESTVILKDKVRDQIETKK